MKKIWILLLSILFITTTVNNLYAQKPSTKVTMGIHLDYFFSGDDGGIKAKSVTEDKPAHKAGIKANDVVLAINDTKIKGLFHYRDLLNKYTPGEKVSLKVKRGDKIIFLDLTF